MPNYYGKPVRIPKLKARFPRMPRPRFNPSAMPYPNIEQERGTPWVKNALKGIWTGAGAGLEALNTVIYSPWDVAGRLTVPDYNPAYDRPFPLIKGTVQGKMAATGLDPSSRLVRYTGSAAGLALDPTNLLFGMGAATAAPRAISRVGKAWKGATAPIWGTRMLTGAAEDVVRGIPGIGRALTKPLSVAAGVKYPFKATGRLATYMAGKEGAVGAVGKAAVGLGKSVAGVFGKTKGGKYVRETQIAQGANTYALNTYREAIDEAALQGGTRALYRHADAPGSPGIIKGILEEMGPERVALAAKELQVTFGKNLGPTIANILEKSPKPEMITQNIRKLPVGKDAKSLMYGLAAEPSKYAAESFGKVRQIQALKEMKISQPLSEERIGYMPHTYSDEGRTFMGKNALWGKWAENLGNTLAQNSPELSQEQIGKIIADSVTPMSSRTAKAKEFHRLPVSRYMRADEINAAAHEAGLPIDMELVTTHPGIAFGKKRMTQFNVIEEQAQKEAIAKDVLQSVDLGPVNNFLRQRVNDANITSHSSVWGPEGLGMKRGTGIADGYYAMKDYVNGGYVWLDRDMADAVVHIHEILNGNMNVSSVGKWAETIWDWFQTRYKSMVLNYSIAYHVRNFIDDNVRMLISGGPIVVADGYSMYSRLRKGSVTLPLRDGSHAYTMAEVEGILAQHGKAPGTGWFGNWADTANGEFLRTLPWYERMNYLKRGSQYIGNERENIQSVAFFMGNLYKYHDLPRLEAEAKAAKDVLDTLFAYTLVAPGIEKSYLARAWLFYRFRRYNIPFQIRMAIEKPLYTALAMKVPEAVMGQPMTEQERDAMPPWLRVAGGFKIGGSGDNITYNAGMGLSVWDLNMLFTPSQWIPQGIGAMAPQVTIPLELYTGSYIFLNKDIGSKARVYTPDLKNTLGKLFPFWKDVEPNDILKTVIVNDRQGNPKEYWVLPGWFVYVLQKMRPANDLRRFLDARNENRLWWVVTGSKDYPVDISQVEENKLRDAYTQRMKEAQVYGVGGMMEMPYVSKRVVRAPEEVVARTQQAIGLYKALNPPQRGVRKLPSLKMPTIKPVKFKPIKVPKAQYAGA